MRKSKSIGKITSEAIQEVFNEISNLERLSSEGSIAKSKNKSCHSKDSVTSKSSNTKMLKMSHLNLGNDEGLDPNGLKFKLRRSLRNYLSRKIEERIEAFTRGESLEEETDKDPDASPEEVAQKFYTRLAEFLKKNDSVLIQVIGHHIFDDSFFSRNVQFIYVEDFFKSLREWGFTYTIREKNDFIQVMTPYKELNGKLILEMIERVLVNLGIKTGLPESTNFLNYEKLEIKSYRIANRINHYWTKFKITNFTDNIKNKIKVVQIISNNKAKDVEYILADDLNNILRNNGLTRDVELNEKLNFWLWISRNNAFDKIMVKKLEKFLATVKNNTYWQYIGLVKRKDPKDLSTISIEQPSNSQPVLNTENDEFDEYDLSEEEDREDKKKARHEKMVLARARRKSKKSNS